MSVLLISRTPLLTRSLAPTLSLHPRLLSTSKKARSPLVLYETSPAGVTTLTMNNPKKLNGWTEPMMYAMRDAFEKVSVKHAVLKQQRCNHLLQTHLPKLYTTPSHPPPTPSFPLSGSFRLRHEGRNLYRSAGSPALLLRRRGLVRHHQAHAVPGLALDDQGGESGRF